RVVYDVDARARLAAQTQHQRDGLVLRLARSRAQESFITSRVAARVRSAASGERLFYGPRHFGVNDERRAESPELHQRGAQFDLRHFGELLDARRYEEAFEAD